ncbi:hypothetical protein WMW71_10515 [Flavobacterium buctense]|uniref:Uncharacterized protein n=1 Tax=Flavobacterium buctense TaxID=1648146 RepID=A0ABU9E4E6_9FLAO|nr:hypothetical protein [Flavobacterium buctense]
MRTRLLITLTASLLVLFTKVVAQSTPPCASNSMNIFKVTPQPGELLIDYYDSNFTPQKCSFKFTLKENVYSNRTRIGRPIFSIITVPFKVREAQDNKPQFVSTGVKNAGINIGLLNWKTDRYFANQTVSTHKLSFGAIIAPSGEELNIDNTDGQIVTKSTQLFISAGLTATYTYNAISFVAIPIGYDFATTSDGRKWMYNQKWWWGFGIGIDTKLLGF